MHHLIPLPASITPGDGTYNLTPEAAIAVTPGTAENMRFGQMLAERLVRATGFRLPLLTTSAGLPKGSILLNMSRLDASHGEEGYEVRVEPERLTLTARQPAGMFHGVQTVRQLFPATLETGSKTAGPWPIQACVIRDKPRFAWRGFMLDVARHFFNAADVRRLIDLLAYYKFNILHLHLTDDQGWRLMVNSRPELARIGGSTAINGDPGGFYTQAEYAELIEYARARFITIVPEVDMPGHTHAALASYPELNASGTAPAPYTGKEVGFSSFSIAKDATYKFLDEVLGEIISLTPGPYFHIGGDEAHSTPDADYRLFVERVQGIVRAHGKQCVGWEEVARGKLLPDTLVQYWTNPEWAQLAARQGNKLILSPATKIYLDIQYDASTPLGQNWTGSYTEVKDAYTWDPSTILPQLPRESVLGVEAPVWTETIPTRDDLDYMVFPRLCGVAEIGWTPLEKRNWSDYKARLADHGVRLAAMGVDFYRSTQIAWKENPAQ